MDELVTDLRFALKNTVERHSANSDTTIGTLDSPCATPDPVRKQPKKRRGRKRRSDNPPPWDCAKDSEESNDSIEEAVKDYVENITMCQSESDDEFLVTKRLSSLRFLPYNPLPERAESDSAVSENIMGLSKRRTKRKRKLKRISQQSNITGQTSMDFCPTGNVKTPRRRARRPRTGKYAKRDASAENESMAMDISGFQSTSTLEPFGELDSHFQGVMGATGYGHKEQCGGVCLSPQSDSSYTDSDGFVTTDEGRLADDENDVESCWEPDVEIIPWWEKRKVSHEDLEEEKFQQILNGVLQYTGVPDGQREYWSKKDGGFDTRLKRVKDHGTYQDDQCSVLVDANRRIGKFLKDPVRTEFAVPIKSKKERDQLFQLAPLYSLHCTVKNSPRNVVVFMKTRNMRRPDKQALRNLLGRELKETCKNKGIGRHLAEVKRRRETPPWDGPVGEFAEPIPASNLGNQMLRDMGWAPGTGLGADRNGITDPIQAYARPRKLGLGHPYP